MNHEIYQIYYDENSKNKLSTNFIALDNSDGPKDWCEFYPILKTLRSIILKEDTWYGFLSPIVFDKIDISADQIFNTLQKYNGHDVMLFSSHWGDLALFNNVWVQGDKTQPGLFKEFNNFLEYSNRNLIKRNLINDFGESVTSNYVIAKKKFWQEWLLLAEDYLNYIEITNTQTDTSYKGKRMSLKIFIQERFPSYILNQNSFQVIHADYSKWNNQLSSTMGYNLHNKSLPCLKSSLLNCNEQKKNFKKTGNTYYLLRYLLEKNKVRLIYKLGYKAKQFSNLINKRHI